MSLDVPRAQSRREVSPTSMPPLCVHCCYMRQVHDSCDTALRPDVRALPTVSGRVRLGSAEVHQSDIRERGAAAERCGARGPV